MIQIAERHPDEQHAMAAHQPGGRGQHRPDEVVHALVAPHHHDGHRAAGDHRRRRERDPLHGPRADLAEDGVANDEEEHEDDGDVEQPLGHDRAQHRALRRLRARRHHHHADRVAGPRRQHVVHGIADHGQRVGVRAQRVRAVVEQQPLPALGAHQRVDAVERDRPDQRRELSRSVGELGRILAQRPPHHGPERHDRDDDAHGGAEPTERAWIGRRDRHSSEIVARCPETSHVHSSTTWPSGSVA